MRKITLMAVVACMAASASAQNPDALKSILAAKDFREAKTLVENAEGLSAEENAKAWNKVVDLALEKFNKESEIAETNKLLKKDEPVDNAGLGEAAVVAVESALKCENYDQQPNEKGKVKAKYHKANFDRLNSARLTLINVGQEAYNAQDYAKAKTAFGTYVDCKDNSLYSEFDFSTDQYLGQVAYFASLASYNAKDYPAANRYADIAIGDTAVAKDATEVKILAMKAQLKTKEDSVKYLNDIKQLYANNPQSERVFSLLAEYYQSIGDKDAKTALVNEQVAKYPSKMSWALKGESEMNAQNWKEAINSYKKSLELDPEFNQVKFNLALCLNNLAISIKDSNDGKLTPEAKSLLEESIEKLNQVKAADPDHQTINWPYMLYQAYYLVGDEANAKALEDLIK